MHHSPQTSSAGADTTRTIRGLVMKQSRAAANNAGVISGKHAGGCPNGMIGPIVACGDDKVMK